MGGDLWNWGPDLDWSPLRVAGGIRCRDLEAPMPRSFYRAPVRRFVDDARLDVLHAELEKAAATAHSEAGAAEITSWRNSLSALATVLDTPELTASEIFIELAMPIGPQRCDALLTGRNAFGEATAVLIELKQWGWARRGPYPEHVVVSGKGGDHARPHPGAQLRGYVTHMRHFHTAFHADSPDQVQLEGVAWLHNMEPGPSLDLLRSAPDYPLLDAYPIFGKDDAPKLAAYLRSRLLPGPSADVADRVETAPTAPSHKLLDLVVQTITHQHEWNLLDTQLTVYWAIRHAVQVAKHSGVPRVIIVRGGPGTGKSVLAIQLLAEAARQHWVVVHATGSKAFQTVLRGRTLKQAGSLLESSFGKRKKKDMPVADIFTTFVEVARAGVAHPGEIDLMVADEAHRLWEHRRIKYPNGMVKWLTDAPMVREVISASKVSAFFLDDNQSVRAGEIGRSQLIEDHAKAMGIEVERFELDEQFRCAGSDSYLRWVEGLFDLRPGNDLAWRQDREYTLRLAATPKEMSDRLSMETSAGRRCRIVAGYCWKWSKPDPLTGEQPHDLIDARFGGWSAPWIEKTGQGLAPELNQYYLWATDESKRGQVGSIYSVQGFEFDYVGVIWGEDLVRRNGKWVFQPDKNKDGAFKKEIRNSKGSDAVQMLLNVYRVLLTRGMKGTFLTVLDDETRAYVEERLAFQYQRQRA
ncbi:ATP-binding protein [Deltaproteobacteria bacterium]|nr:ATP-binding protein [Deltaproteobacteria bacterium]